MAENQGLPNVVEARWILSEETGKLRCEGVRTVSHSPCQEIWVEPIGENLSPALFERYARIEADRKARGIE